MSYALCMPTRNAINPRPIQIDSRPPTEATTPTLFRHPVVPTFIPHTPQVRQAIRPLPSPPYTLDLQ